MVNEVNIYTMKYNYCQKSKINNTGNEINLFKKIKYITRNKYLRNLIYKHQ